MTAASISYYKRYKMEAALDGLPAPRLPDGFSVLPWQPGLLDHHSEVLYGCFKDEIDGIVFPSLGNRDGCALLMLEISRRRNFVPEATWLLVGPAGPCGTIQALRERSAYGSIQNVGVLPPCRGQGLGKALLLYALHGFWRIGLGRAQLEVTAYNEGAVRLYAQLGFRRAKTLYKAVAVPSGMIL